MEGKKSKHLETLIIAEPQLSLGLLGISWEALKTITRNRRPLASLLLFVFLSFSLLELASFLVLSPLLADISLKKSLWDELGLSHTYNGAILRDIQKDAGLVLLLGMLLLPLYYVTLLFFWAGTIFSSSEAYTAKVLSLKDMFLNIKGRWKRPISISFYMTMMSLSFLALLFLLKRVISSMDLILVYELRLISFVVLLLLGVCCYVYLAALWGMSIVVSVIESESSGLKAIDRAIDLMKLGRRGGQAYVIKLLMIVASVAVFKMYSSMTTSDQLEQVGWTRLAIKIPIIWIMCVVKLFVLVTYTLLYHECNQNYKGKDDAVLVGAYVPVALDQV